MQADPSRDRSGPSPLATALSFRELQKRYAVENLTLER